MKSNQKNLNLASNRLMWLGVVLGVLLIALVTLTPMVVLGADTMAELYDTQGRVVGMAMMTDVGDGGVMVEVTLNGMNPVAGDHRMAIAEVGMCETPDFTSAGDDVGTFPDIQFYSGGNANYKLTVEGLDLSTLPDSDGSSLVIYADKGDLDEAGSRIICGVIYAPTSEITMEEDADTEDADMEEPSMEEPSMEEPGMEEPSMEEPGMEEPSMEEPGMEEPGMEEPSMEEPGMEEPSMEEPGMEEPSMEEPSMEEPGMEEPSMEEPSMEEPAEVQDVVEASAGTLLWDVQGRTVGAAVMIQDAGAIGVAVVVEGMEPIPGDHRIAITEQAACDAPDYSSAGDEIGRLPDIQFYSSGKAEYEQVIETDMTVADLLDEDGSALVIYADTGDEPGPRIICGIIEPLDNLLDGLGIPTAQ